MITISNNGFISITRGDSFSVPLFIDRGTRTKPVRYYIADHPKASVYLGIMEPNQPFETATVRKKFTCDSKINEYGDLIIEIRPADTEYLLPGKYYYSVKAQLDENNIETLIPRTEFVIYE